MGLLPQLGRAPRNAQLGVDPLLRRGGGERLERADVLLGAGRAQSAVPNSPWRRTTSSSGTPSTVTPTVPSTDGHDLGQLLKTIESIVV